jgi:hypothetical protein
MEVTPVVVEVGPVVSVTVSVTVAAAMEDRRRAKATTAEHRPCTEAAAMNGSAPETATTECSAATAEATAMETGTTTAEAAATTAAAKTATAHPAAALHLDRQTVDCVFC